MSSESQTVVPSDEADPPRFVDPTEVFADVYDLLGRKWHLRIVYHLLEAGPMGFSALKSRVDGISSKMLSESLASLGEQGIVTRDIVSEQPVRVEYSLTERGRALEPTVDAVVRWDANYGLAGDA